MLIKNTRHHLMNEVKSFPCKFLGLFKKQFHSITNKQVDVSNPERIFPVFQRQGLDAMLRLYRSKMHFFSYRLKHYLWQGFTGIRLLHFMTCINEAAKASLNVPLARCANDVLKKLHFSFSVDWQIDTKLIKGNPVIFYAQHPGYIEPLVCLAILKDFNPKVVSTAWIRNISESVSKQIIAVPDSKEATRKKLQRYKGLRKLLETIWANILTFQVINYLQGDMTAIECRRQRRQAISDIISALGGNNSILLFPSGGEGQKPWAGEFPVYFEKLMCIITGNQRRIPKLAGLHFVPLIMKGSLSALFNSQVMIPWHPVTFLFRLLQKRSCQFVIREHIALKDLVDQKMDSKEIVSYLMKKLIL